MKKLTTLLILFLAILCFAEEEKKAILYEFGSSTCIPCKKMKPILTKVSEERVDSLIVEIVDLKKDYNKRTLINKYKIRVMPTQILVDTEGKEVWRHQGYIPMEKLNEVLDKHLTEKVEKKDA